MNLGPGLALSLMSILYTPSNQVPAAKAFGPPFFMP